MQNLKYFSALGAALTISFMLRGQSGPDSWITHDGGKFSDHGNALATDNSGNVYVTGSYQLLSNFGDLELHASGDTDIFLAKYTAGGHLDWVRSAGSQTVNGSITEYGSDIAVVGDHVYVTGIFSSIARFGDVEVLSAGGDDIFLAKYSLDGTLIWVRTAGGPSQDISYSMAADASGNIYLTGLFQKHARFEHGEAIALNAAEMFLAKYDPNGTLVWLKQSFSDVQGVGKKIKCNDRACIVAGEFEGTVKLDGSVLPVKTQSVIIARYDLSGTLTWTRELENSGTVSIDDLLVLENDIYLAGSFYNSMSVDDRTILTKGGSDIYLARLDHEGKISWLSSIGGPQMEKRAMLAMTHWGDVALAGNYNGYLDLNDLTLYSKGADDIFLATISTEGKVTSTQSFGGVGQDQAQSIHVDGKSLLLTGYFRNEVQINDQSLSSSGESDILLCKLKLDAPTSSQENAEASVRLYPNPSQGTFSVECPDVMQTIRIYDITGKLVFQLDDIESARANINLKTAAAGVMLVKVVARNGMYETRLLLEPRQNKKINE